MAFPHEEESSAIVQLKEVGAHLGTTFSAARYDSKADTLSRLSYDELTQLHIAPSAREQEPKEHASDSSRHPSEAIDRTRNTLGYQRVSIACASCRGRKRRCEVDESDPQQRCRTCIRLEEDCILYPVEQQSVFREEPEPFSFMDNILVPSFGSSSTDWSLQDQDPYSFYGLQETDQGELEDALHLELSPNLHFISSDDLNHSTALSEAGMGKENDLNDVLHTGTRAKSAPSGSDYVMRSTENRESAGVTRGQDTDVGTLEGSASIAESLVKDQIEGSLLDISFTCSKIDDFSSKHAAELSVGDCDEKRRLDKDVSQDSARSHREAPSCSLEPSELGVTTDQSLSRIGQLLTEYDACDEETESSYSDQHSQDSDYRELDLGASRALTSTHAGFRGHTVTNDEKRGSSGDNTWAKSTGATTNRNSFQESFSSSNSGFGKRSSREDEPSDDDEDRRPRKARKLRDDRDYETRNPGEMIPCIELDCPGQNPDISTLTRKLACAHGKCICITCWTPLPRDQYNQHMTAKDCESRCVCKQSQPKEHEHGPIPPHERQGSCIRDRKELKTCQYVYICQTFNAPPAAFKWDVPRPHVGEKQRVGRKNQLRDEIIAETRKVQAENDALKANNRDKDHQVRELQNIIKAFKEHLETFMAVPRSLLQRLKDYAPAVVKPSSPSSSTQEGMLRTPESYNISQKAASQMAFAGSLESPDGGFSQVEFGGLADNSASGTNSAGRRTTATALGVVSDPQQFPDQQYAAMLREGMFFEEEPILDWNAVDGEDNNAFEP